MIKLQGLIMVRRTPLQLSPKRGRRPADSGGATAEAKATDSGGATAEAKARAKCLRDLDKKIAKQQQAADAKLYHPML